MMKKIITSLLLTFFIFSLKAQIQEGGVPPSFAKTNDITNIDTRTMSIVDEVNLRAQDAVTDEQKDIPWRFGENLAVNIGLENAGTWEILPSGDRLWRVRIYSQGAQTINLGFNDFFLAQGAEMYIYNEEKTSLIGAFTANNNKTHNTFATSFIEGESVIVELVEPMAVHGLSRLNINRVTHGYRSLDYKVELKGIGDSGNCNNNVICPEGDDWRDEIRAVGILITGGSSFCSGTLINNTCEDGTPYFLTANHCISGNSAADFDAIIVQFNFESSQCNTNSFTAPSQTVSGTDLMASNAGSDFGLLKLEDTPPTDYNVYYVGWDRSGALPTSQVGIHHPAGDLKKISFDNQAAVQAVYSGAQCWNILNWEDGTTEGGSSGSALFDQNHRLIGQLYGGTASCSSITDDYYGRFDVSWDSGSGSTDELQSWLDGCNTGSMTLDGYDPNAILVDNDIQLSFVGTPSSENCGQVIAQQIRIRNAGNNAVTAVTFAYGLDGVQDSYVWSGSLASGESEIVVLDDIVLCSGEYTYAAEIVSSNLSIDEVPANDGFTFDFEIIGGEQYTIVVQENAYGSETTFTLEDEDGAFLLSEGPFTDFDLANHSYSFCLPSGDYTFTINDSGADGLTSVFFGFDVGYYQILKNGVEIAFGDAFGAQAVVDFSASGSAIIADFDVVVTGNNVTVSDVSTGGTVLSQEWVATDAVNESGSGASFSTSYVAAGTYSITLYVMTDVGCEEVTKSFVIEAGGLSAIQNADVYGLSIYPNPSNGEVNISFDANEDLYLSLFNTLGAVVQDFGVVSADDVIKINNLASGIYFVKLEGESGLSVKKIIVR